jgi:hypothetical protein
MEETAKGTRRVGIYGTRLGLSAVAARLREIPGLEVQNIQGRPPYIIDHPDAALPEFVLFDLTAGEPDFVIHLMHAHPTITVIGVDLLHHKMLVVSGRQSRLLTEEDLMRVIGTGVIN